MLFYALAMFGLYQDKDNLLFTDVAAVDDVDDDICFVLDKHTKMSFVVELAR
jgi:hypothetical protein